MQKQILSISNDGFYGIWYPHPKTQTSRAIILMLSDSSDNRLARAGVKWLQRQNLHVLCVSPDKKERGRHHEPLERIGKAIDFLHARACEKIGIFGASATATLALLAASYYPEISLTLALTPSDFVLEGYYRDGLDGARERPGNHESSVSWGGKPLPYLPYAYRHPDYWQKIKEEAKAGGNLIAARQLFDESELRHPLSEEEFVKIERICGKVLCIGAEDDALWDSCRYIRRMQQRLARLPHSCDFQGLTYAHGTHFVFPESMLQQILPLASGLMVRLMFKAAREFPKACKETRIYLDHKLAQTLRDW